MLESSKEELAENREPKRVAFSDGEQAIDPSGWKRGGKLELQKLLETFLAKDERELLEGKAVRISHFLLTKECLVLQRFLAEIKAE